jgi:hypothetical protein
VNEFDAKPGLEATHALANCRFGYTQRVRGLGEVQVFRCLNEGLNAGEMIYLPHLNPFCCCATPGWYWPKYLDWSLPKALTPEARPPYFTREGREALPSAD